jgi:uncharacterized protein
MEVCMPLKFNIRHLEPNNLSLNGELPVSELEIEQLDEVIHTRQPLIYDLEVQKLENAVLVQGSLRLNLDCECVRCLKPFRQQLALDNWACHLPLQGEDKVQVSNDTVDLTPYIREDIVLSLPRHPLCEPECKGLASPNKGLALGGLQKEQPPSSAWAVLNKLKL